MTTVDIKDRIKSIAKEKADTLKENMDNRVKDMKDDDKSHFLIYRALGISDEEGNLIDVYQNKGRFLYKYAGAFLEDAAKECFKEKFPKAIKKHIPNTRGKKPVNFEIDLLVDNDALEIKWRDATTDGDHITKEHTRILTIKDAGYVPIRVMFYYPNREQSARIQKTLETLYKGVSGFYYAGDEAWKYVKEKTGVDLFKIITDIAKENDEAKKQN
jgi:hypothetical protein